MKHLGVEFCDEYHHIETPVCCRCGSVSLEDVLEKKIPVEPFLLRGHYDSKQLNFDAANFVHEDNQVLRKKMHRQN